MGVETIFAPDSPNPWSWAFVVFRDVSGSPYHVVGTDGSVWSRYTRKWKRLKPFIDRDGYARFTIRRGGKLYSQYSHRLVLEMFVGVCPEGMEGLHCNGNPANNDVRNLRWGDDFENKADSLRHGTVPAGESHGMSRMSNADAAEAMRLYRSGMSGIQIARIFNVRDTTIYRIIRGHTKHLSILSRASQPTS